MLAETGIRSKGEEFFAVAVGVLFETVINCNLKCGGDSRTD